MCTKGGGAAAAAVDSIFKGAVNPYQVLACNLQKFFKALNLFSAWKGQVKAWNGFAAPSKLESAAAIYQQSDMPFSIRGYPAAWLLQYAVKQYFKIEAGHLGVRKYGFLLFWRKI